MLHPVPSALALALAAFLAAGPALADTATSAPATAPPSTSGDTEASNNFSIVRYRADYQVRPDAGNVQTETYEVLLKTKASVEQFSQVRLSYSEKMETLEVLGAYTITADGQRRDVPADRIYTQESYSSASAAMYADRKVRVIVFPNLAPGTRLYYQVRRTQVTPYFPGYFGLWETFNVFTEYEDAEVTLSAPANLPMFVDSRGVQGSDRPTVKNGQAQWRWRYQRREAMPAQNWSAAGWEFGPNIMASTYRDWSQMGRAYQLKAGPAAQVTPELQALADEITTGISDRREQADALYRWVAQNIRYVAVYLGNGGLEPNSAQSILDNHYGDCKDHVTILEALLAAKGIASSPVLIGAGGGPTLPKIPVLGRFNHAITYIPEFDLYLDSTTAWARFGQLPEGDLGAPVMRTRDATLARTPANTPERNATSMEVRFTFDANGNLRGETIPKLGENAPKQLVVPQPLQGDSLQVDGQALQLIGLGGPTPDRTVVWIPSIKTVAGGIPVMAGEHVWMADTQTPQSHSDWLATLARIKALGPDVVIPGHFAGTMPAGTAAVDFTADYIRAFDEETAKAKDGAALEAAMKQRFPNLGGLEGLALSAKVAKGEMQWH